MAKIIDYSQKVDKTDERRVPCSGCGNEIDNIGERPKKDEDDLEIVIRWVTFEDLVRWQDALSDENK